MERYQVKHFFGELPLQIQLALPPEASVFKSWFPRENGSADDGAAKELFSKVWKARNEAELSEKTEREERELFPYMGRVCPADDWEMHHAARSSGCVCLYGGKKGKFDQAAFLRGPLWIGDECAIRLGARVVGPAMIGHRVEIGGSSLCECSIIGSDTMVDDGAQVKGSLVGSRVYIGPQVLLLDRPLEPVKEIVVYEACYPSYFDEHDWRVVIPYSRYGTVIGDGCRIGARAIIPAGTVLGKGCIVPEGVCLRPGIYAANTLSIGLHNGIPPIGW